MNDFSKSSITHLVLLLAMYVSSGVLQPVLVEVLTYNGACERSTLLYVLPNYIGMSLSIFANYTKGTRQGTIRWGTITALSLTDVISCYLNFSGLVNAGSLIFTVIYSSVTVYTALFAYLFLGRRLHALQWVAVFVIMVGLITGGLGATFMGGQDVILGIVQILIGSMFHSMTYIISEYLLVKTEDPIAPELMGSILGLFGIVIFGIWQAVYTIPNFQHLVIDNIAAKNGDINVIFTTLSILIVVNFIHAFCFFHLLNLVGSTTTGVMKGVQSVLVFGISHFAFCSYQQSQCFTLAKAFSLCIVVCGVILYSTFKIEKKDEYDPIIEESKKGAKFSPSLSLGIFELPTKIKSLDLLVAYQQSDNQQNKL